MADFDADRALVGCADQAPAGLDATRFDHGERALLHALRELKEARRDLADASLFACEPDAEDRYAEAEQRLENLREEFDTRLVAITGLTIESLRNAYSEALL